MRKTIIAGNWKMNTTLQEGVQLAKDVRESIEGKELKCEVVLGVPFTHLAAVADAVMGTPIKVAAENCADQEKGAYTGEVSATMVASTGAEYVILGHSERRQYYHETSEILTKKVELALANELKPIFCIGEVLEEREAGKHFEVVERQVREALFGLSKEDFGKIALAYEPVWAIGTGKTATSAEAQEIHEHIRKVVAEKYGAEVADDLTILYGGSMNGGNAADLLSKSDVDGGLIGGASLSAEKFLPIIEAV
ncbi:MAG: triose-phosphate isomerase [Porphyromonas sp.]|nr:triose-phosphate isomerase [Porphyromonas sp.]